MTSSSSPHNSPPGYHFCRVSVRFHEACALGLVMILLTHIDGLVQERLNSSALAVESRLSCAKPWIYVSKQRCHWLFPCLVNIR